MYKLNNHVDLAFINIWHTHREHTKNKDKNSKNHKES